MSMSTHLYRSRDDRMLAGVAGGLAELWDADPSLVRIVWALLVPLTGGIALVVYIVMAIVVPEEEGRRAWDGDWVGGVPRPSTATDAAGSTGNASPVGEPPPPPAPSAQPAGGGVTSGAWQTSRFEAREKRREARHAAREARRARGGRDGRSGAIVVGVLFILVGAWYLVREFLPTIDWDWFWPLVLVVVGVLVLVLAVRPRDDTGTTGPDGGGGS
jgi:phage shock protein C